MKLKEINKIRKPYFGYEELAGVLQINKASARVAAARYVRQGIFLRIKKNIYVLREVWNNMAKKEKFALANLGQSPSYISLMTALDYYEITTQMQRDFYESIAVKRTKEIFLNGTVFRYSRIAPELYFGFVKDKDFFIASPEKALLDAFYLMTFGRYALDISALDPEKLDFNEIKILAGKFPLKTRKLLNKHGYL